MKKNIERCIRGWLPKEANQLASKRSVGQRSFLNRRIVILISVSVGCFVLFVSGVFIFLSWYSERALKNLSEFSTRLEDDGFTIEQQPLSTLQMERTIEWYWFGDFRFYAGQQNISTIFYDPNVKSLYYLTPVSPTNSSLVTNIFYYNKIF